MLMEEGVQDNSYISQRGQAIESIERTIAELGGIFGQLASMVSERKCDPSHFPFFSRVALFTGLLMWGKCRIGDDTTDRCEY